MSPVPVAPKRKMNDFLVSLILQLDDKKHSVLFHSAPESLESRKGIMSLDIVYALQKWRRYLCVELFIILTDHFSLKWL